MRKRLLTILSIFVIAALFTACSPAATEPAGDESVVGRIRGR